MVTSARSTLTEVRPGADTRHAKTGEVAEAMRPVIEASFGASIPLGFEFWDGSKRSPRDSSLGTIRFNSPDAIRRLLWMPNELGLGRAYVAGDLDIDGDLYDVLTTFRDAKPTVLEATRGWRVLPSRGSCRQASGRARQAVATSAGRSAAARAATLVAPRCIGGHASLRRGQRLLPVGARPDA